MGRFFIIVHISGYSSKGDPMTENDTITTMEEFMKRLNGTRAEVCQEFRKMFIGMGIPENEADRLVNKQADYTEMCILSGCADRKLALEVFGALDEGRKGAIIGSLKETSADIRDEIARREQGIQLEEDSPYHETSMDSLKEWLDECVRFGKEIDIDV